MRNRVLVSVMGDSGFDTFSASSEAENTQPPADDTTGGSSSTAMSGSPSDFCSPNLRGLGQKLYRGDPEAILLQAMDYLKLDGEEVSVSFCTDNQIKDLNNAWRGIEESTDVLSFEDGDEYTDEDGVKWRAMGDIVISYETLSRAQEEVGEDADAELRRLLVHGLLHLNGYDHGEEHLTKGKEPVCEMLKLQEDVLRHCEPCASVIASGSEAISRHC